MALWQAGNSVTCVVQSLNLIFEVEVEVCFDSERGKVMDRCERGSRRWVGSSISSLKERLACRSQNCGIEVERGASIIPPRMSRTIVRLFTGPGITCVSYVRLHTGFRFTNNLDYYVRDEKKKTQRGLVL